MEALHFLLVLFGVISALVAAERKRRNLLSPIAKGRHGEQSLRAALSTLPGAPTFFPNLYPLRRRVGGGGDVVE